MSDEQLSKLVQAIREAVAKVQRFQDRNLGEQNTKASLIEPILEALGWDTRDPDEVHREFKPTSKDSPVDYALSLFRKPRLFVEAKGLGEQLSDRKWIAQVLGDAVVAGVEWCILSDGDEYRFYNATAAVDAEEKLFCQIRLTTGPEENAAKTLNLISRMNMEENLLDVLWSAYFVDRRVKQALQEMVATPEKGLVRMIRCKVARLSPREIVESLRRLDVRIESPTPVPEPKRQKGTGSGRRPERKGTKQKSEKAHYGVSLADLISAGLFSPPLPLFRKYRCKKMEAILLPDGSVEFEGSRYHSCSTAAEVARSTVTGRRMNTNGWLFWQYLDSQGKPVTLLDVRTRFLSAKRQGG
jgi:hypothetical protein